ncbi:hypothetical protein V2J09_000541 [Rumex salicifolius]
MADDTEKRLHSVMEKLFYTPKHSSLPSEQTRGVKRPHSILMSKHNTDRDEDVLAKALTCRPWDRGDLMRRLATFKSMTWFAKPKAVDAVNCARRGWINVEMDVIACEMCGSRLLFTTPASWNRHQVEKAASVFSLKLDNGHKLLCPWMDNCCDEKLAFFAPTRTEVLVEHYRERSSALLKLSALPLISASAIRSMKNPLLEQFLRQSISTEYDTGPDGSPCTEFLGTDSEAVSTNSYYQAHRLLSLCGWQPRFLPYFVDCKEGAKKSSTLALSQASPVELNNKLTVYSSGSGEKSGSDENSFASDIPCEPNSVVLDCKLCGASTGLWTFALVSRPLELVRVVGYTETDSRTPGTDNLGCGNHATGGTLNRVALLPKGGIANMTIAGGPLPAEQNFRATISVPVIGRNIRAQFSYSSLIGGDASESVHISNPNREVATESLLDVDPASDQGDEPSPGVKDIGKPGQVANELSAQEGSNHTNGTDQNVCKNVDRGVHLQQEVRNKMTCIAEDMVLPSDDSQNETNVRNPVESLINNDAIQLSIDKNTKRVSSTNKMEFDPLCQHRHFCPLVTSTETVSPGWKQTLLALKKEKFFTAIESEDSPMSTSLIKIDDPITSIRRLFKSPSSKPARSTRGSS